MRWSGGTVERCERVAALVGARALCRLPPRPLRAQDIDEGREALRTGKYQEAITHSLEGPGDRQPVDRRAAVARRARMRRSANTMRPKTTARRATAAKGGSALWNTLGEVLLVRGKRARRRERVRSRRRRARARQSDRGAQSRRPPLRSRRARSRDEGVRPVHRRLQRRGRREPDERRARRRRDAPSNTSAPTIRSCSRTRSRHTIARSLADPMNADAQA